MRGLLGEGGGEEGDEDAGGGAVEDADGGSGDPAGGVGRREETGNGGEGGLR